MTQLPSVKDQMKALESLQELDLKIDSLKKRKAEIPVALKTLEDSFKKSFLVIEAKKNDITEFEKVRRQSQGASEINRDRLARSAVKRDNVKNSTEFQAANKEIEQLEKALASSDEQDKRLAADIENAKTMLLSLDEQLEKVKGERDSQASVVNTQIEQLDSEIGKMTESRLQYSSIIERSALSRYDRVRGAKAGIGLAPAYGGRCGGCNMVVPPQLYNQVQKGQEIQQCPSCHRILFVPEDKK